jgi:hypothetical protein
VSSLSEPDASADSASSAPATDASISRSPSEQDRSGASAESGFAALGPLIPHLSTRRWLTLLTVVATAAHVSAIRTGYLLDDFLHVSMLHGRFPAPRHPLDLYNFVDDSDRAAMLEQGLLPWWTHPQLTIRFLRPLSSALLWLDHALFGDHALPMHLHTLAWWLAMVLAAFALYRRFLGERVARIGAFVFALAPCHAMPLSWLANRDALVSLGVGIPALYAYAHARETRTPRHSLLATLLFAIAFLGGEYTLSFTAYVMTFEVMRRDESVVRRAIGVLPFVVPMATYMGVRTALHYGTVGSGYYTDPFVAPEYFLWVAPRRFVTCLLDAWLALDTDTIDFRTADWVLFVGAAALVVAVFLAARHLVRDKDEPVRRAALWLGGGSVIALAPVLAVMPGQRVLGAAMFGVAPLVGLVLEGAWFPRAAEARRGAAELGQLTALCLGFAHLVHGPVTGMLAEAHYRDSSERFRRQMDSVHARIGDARTADAIVVRGSGDAFFMPFGVEPDGRTPRHWGVLSLVGSVLVIRTGEREIDMYAEPDVGLFPPGEGNLFLDTGFLLTAGETFRGTGFTATITRMNEGRVAVVHFVFDEAFMQSRVWLNETPKRYFDGVLPNLGEGRPYESDR